MSRVRALFLDAHHTLFRESPPRAAIYAEVAQRHGLKVDPAAIARAMQHAYATLPQRIGAAYRYTRPWFVHFIDAVFAQVGVAATDALRADLFERFGRETTFALYPDVLPLLRMARPRLAVIGVISNWAPTLPELLERLQLATWFDVVVASASEECEKPERKLFELALQRSGIAPHEALHVGDHPVNDLAGARSAGMEARLLLRGVALEAGREAVPPGDTIATLAELDALL